MHGSVETTANQITLDFVLEKRRFGKSTIAQKVGIMGMIIITININKFNVLKVILPAPADLPECLLEQDRCRVDVRRHAAGVKLLHLAGIYKLSCPAPQVRKSE